MTDTMKITIEIDGKQVCVEPGSMIIEAADQENIYIPRFCYHHKLSIAANCRMCLVEVEKAPKPLPACATPVSEGMKIWTGSKTAKQAQKAVMEFLLINHPLDCPICDQGGECELQDTALGYGKDIARFEEGKRVVTDKNLGPLISTDLTRCIICTRCVRFGTEIAGRTELGALGRGEFSKIRTFVEAEMDSEISGNVIDLCPVGALTSKPFRFRARAWELKQYDNISTFDSWGTNLHYHVRGSEILRCVPKENESINEVWLSDRDRFGYEGFYSSDRLTNPLVKNGSVWQETTWDNALKICSDKIITAKSQNGANSIGALANANSTTEEMYLLQKIMRELGTNNVDHRLKQQDFSMQDRWPEYPNIRMDIADIEELDNVVIVGSNLNKFLPLAAVRLRKLHANDGTICTINPAVFDSSFTVKQNLLVRKGNFVDAVLDFAYALGKTIKNKELQFLGAKNTKCKVAQDLAADFNAASSKAILVGDMVLMHPQADTILAILSSIANICGAKLALLNMEANTAGAWIAGCIPHRGANSSNIGTPGLHALDMLKAELSVYTLLNVEPRQDIFESTQAKKALMNADFVLALSQYRDDMIEQVADVILPISVHPENEGSSVNVTGNVQKFPLTVAPRGESKPAWKVLRVLANHLKLEGFNYKDILELQKEVYGQDIAKYPEGAWSLNMIPSWELSDIVLIHSAGLYSTHATIRRASSLQETIAAKSSCQLQLSPHAISSIGENNGNIAIVFADGKQIQVEFTLNESLDDGTAIINSGTELAAALGKPYSSISIKEVKANYD